MSPEMRFSLTTTIVLALSAGCNKDKPEMTQEAASNQPASAAKPDDAMPAKAMDKKADEAEKVAAQDSEKACCKGLNDCKGKGGCAVEGSNSCAGHNECKGKGGCNMHCPK